MVFDIIIIGSGLGGYTLVREIRRLNKEKRILIVTADDGTYYSKPMLSTGFAKHKSAAALAGKSANQMADDLDITVYANTQVLSIDKEQKRVNIENALESIIYSETLVLATGAEPVNIPLPKALEGRTLAINDLMDYGTFREQLGGQKNVAIIGSGLVGTEYANDMVNGGLNVSVIALDDGPLQLLLPPTLSQTVQQQLADLGINWHFNCSIEDACLNDNEQIELSLTNGTKLTCDIVLSAVGLRPRTQLAKAAGLVVSQGIKVDANLQTSDENIYSLGDCAEINGNVLMYVAPLTVSAKALAKTLTGEATPVKIPASPVIVKTPGCPVVANPPPKDSEGQWQIEGEAPDLKACFYDNDNNLTGFGLCGKKVMERMKLSKQLPAII